MMIEATVVGNGTFYTDNTERLYIHIPKSSAHELSNKDGKRVPITIVIGDVEYRGTHSTRSDFPYIYIGARLIDADGKEHKQTYLLIANGLLKKSKVQLSVSDNKIVLA